MLPINGIIEWCSAVIIWFVGIDVAPSEQHFHYSLVPPISSIIEWCFAVIIWFVGIDVFPSEQYPVFPTGQAGQASVKPGPACRNSLGSSLARACRPG